MFLFFCAVMNGSFSPIEPFPLRHPRLSKSRSLFNPRTALFHAIRSLDGLWASITWPALCKNQLTHLSEKLRSRRTSYWSEYLLARRYIDNIRNLLLLSRLVIVIWKKSARLIELKFWSFRIVLRINNREETRIKGYIFAVQIMDGVVKIISRDIFKSESLRVYPFKREFIH